MHFTKSEYNYRLPVKFLYVLLKRVYFFSEKLLDLDFINLFSAKIRNALI